MARLALAPLELILGFALLAAGWAAHVANTHLDASEQEAIETGEVGPLPNGEVLRVAALGAGCLAAQTSPNQVATALTQVLTDSRYRSAAERFAVTYRQFNPARVVVNLADHLERLLSRSTTSPARSGQCEISAGSVKPL